MEFMTTNTLDQCKRYLAEHAYEVPVIASTEVSIDPLGYKSYEYSVRRVWKGLNGAWRYTVLETKGDLESTTDNKTKVTAKTELHGMGFVLIGFIVAFFAYGFAGGGLLAWGLGIFLLVLFIGDIYVLRQIINELKP